MIITSSPNEIDYNELATLKELALMGAMDAETEITTNELADRLDISPQTISRRLRTLEDMKTISRDTRPDGQSVFIENEGIMALEREYTEYRQLFESQPDLELTGHVTKGVGEGKHFVSLAGYQEQFIDRLGYEPYPGTMNIDLQPASASKRVRLEMIDGIQIDEWETEDRTYGAATAYPVRIETKDGDRYDEGHILVPDRTHHGDEKLELIAPDKLRDELDLTEDQEVILYVIR